jgi:hypothetical protein
MACGSSSNSGANADATAPGGSSSTDQVYKIGDQVNIQTVLILTVHSLTKSVTDTGHSGTMYVIVDATINYLGSMNDIPSQSVFGYFAPGFGLQNAAGDKYSKPLFWSDVTGTYDGDGTPYTSEERNSETVVRGPIPFEVPTDQHEFVLTYGALQAGDSRVWTWDLHLS